ncbi:hypothetical protein T11_11738 [Trichinella zimbabwensis]|uniref:Uncharacterized protein n=1 Tax=Trichinella zimbabwensis TaxID=268475 RepID=A0A0V1HH70_9BILA|nr:hypothetical protein T11_11738 [Trichinella zimbabwensis]
MYVIDLCIETSGFQFYISIYNKMLLQYFFADNSDFAPKKTPVENMRLSLKSIEKMLLDVAVFLSKEHD